MQATDASFNAHESYDLICQLYHLICERLLIISLEF